MAEINRPGEDRKIVMLSVAHLFYAGRSGNALGPIAQPGDRACTPLPVPSAPAVVQTTSEGPCAASFPQKSTPPSRQFMWESNSSREIEGIGPVRGTHEITHAEAHNPGAPFRVRKRGIRTRLTEGQVRLLDFATHTKGLDDSFKRAATQQILIQPRTLAAAPITAIARTA